MAFESKMSTNEKLGDLLLREDILSKVLVHLVDSGLHECRRVCRKWYEVCNKLPVKLSLSLRDNCFVKPDLFPNTVSLKLSNDISWKSAVIEKHLLPWLSKLNRITHLEFSVREWPSVRFQSNLLPILYSVRSLSVTVLCDCAFIDFLETLRCLTGLTALEMPIGYNDVIDVAPLTEMKELRTLKASSCFIVNRNNEFIFGTQTQLTKLEIVHVFHPVSRGVITLQVMPVTVLLSLRPYSLVDDLSAHRKSALSDPRWKDDTGRFADQRL